MPVDAKYRTTATASGGGRSGRTELADGTLGFQLVVPKELGGPGGDGANPEKLFALGYSACFLGAMRVAATQTGIKVPDGTTVTATVGIGPREEGGFGLTIALSIAVPGVPRGEAEALVAKAHQVCPYSNATRNNIDVKLTVE